MSQRPAPLPDAPLPFTFPSVSRTALAGGLSVLTSRLGKLPIVAVRVVLRGGAAADPQQAEGLARLTAAALDTGTDRQDGPTLAWELERIGIELDISAQWDAIVMQASVPAERLDPALELLSAIAQRASFPPDDVERVRAEQLAEILQRRAEPRALADDAAARFIFAEGSRYARPLIGTREAIERLDRADVTAFHRNFFVPSSAAVVLAGAIDEERARELVLAHFGRWAGADAQPPSLLVAPRSAECRIEVVDRPAAVQSEIRAGHMGVSRSHPDVVPLLVMNTILGGAFTSRLNLNLRERHGFTYGVRSGFGFRRKGGSFVIATAVGTEVTHAAVQEIAGEVRRMHEHGATEEEVIDARDYMTGVMPLELQTAEQVADQLVLLFVHDLPEDWHRRHRQEIAAVPAAEVARAAAAHLRPGSLVLTVVGPAATIADPLAALGLGSVQVHEVDS
jgi:zinc protease